MAGRLCKGRKSMMAESCGDATLGTWCLVTSGQRDSHLAKSYADRRLLRIQHRFHRHNATDSLTVLPPSHHLH